MKALLFLTILSLVSCMPMIEAPGKKSFAEFEERREGGKTGSKKFLQAFQVIKAKCLDCHSPDSLSAAKAYPFDYNNEEDFFNSPYFDRGNPESIALTRMKYHNDSTLYPQNMPPSSYSFSKEEYLSVRSWIISAGSPASSLNFDPKFNCVNPTASKAQEIKRLSKRYIKNSIDELLSPIREDYRNELLSSIQSELSQIPDDLGEKYLHNDNTISVYHVNSLFKVSSSLGKKISSDSKYMNAYIQSTCASGEDLSSSSCLDKVVHRLSKLAFRRPDVSESETTKLKDLYTTFESKSFDGFAGVVANLISHPQFYYRFESDGSLLNGNEGVDATYKLDKFEFLSKITFLFWSSSPSEQLIDLLEAENFETDSEVKTFVQNNILSDDRVDNGIVTFVDEWLELGKVEKPGDNTNTENFQTLLNNVGLSSVSSRYRNDLIQEIRDLFKLHAFKRDDNYADFLNTPYSLPRNSDLAKVYDLPTSWNGDFSSPLLVSPNRRSLLSKVALTGTGGQYTRPIIKGLRIRQRVLCDTLPNFEAADGDTRTLALAHTPTKNTREVVAEATSGDCMGCHQYMNPLGFVSENFGPLGEIRSKEIKFNTDRSLTEVNINTEVKPALFLGDDSTINSVTQLSQLISDTGKGQACFVSQVYEYAHGQASSEFNACDQESMRLSLTRDGGSISDMFLELITMDSFRRRKIK